MKKQIILPAIILAILLLVVAYMSSLSKKPVQISYGQTVSSNSFVLDKKDIGEVEGMLYVYGTWRNLQKSENVQTKGVIQSAHIECNSLIKNECIDFGAAVYPDTSGKYGIKNILWRYDIVKNTFDHSKGDGIIEAKPHFPGIESDVRLIIDFGKGTAGLYEFYDAVHQKNYDIPVKISEIY